MNRIIFTLGVWLFPAACTALGAAGVFLLRRQTRPATRRILCGMAAGIMLAASVWSLLLPAIARSQGRAAWVPPALGLILGAVGLLRLEDAAGQLLAGGPGHCGRMVLAVTLHNLPEGMVVGLAAALALHGDADAVSGALALSLGIGLQNIPEGAAVSLPLTQSGRTRGQSFAAGAASGLVEPLGAVLAFVLALAAGRWPVVEVLLRPYVLAIKAVPVASFIILALIWMRTSALPLFISFLMVFPILYTNVLAGLRSADSQLLEMARAFRVPWRRQLHSILLPAVEPFLLAGCAAALGMSWKAGVAAEVIGVVAGSLGERLYDAKIYLQTADLLAWTVVIVALSALFERLVLALLRRGFRRLERGCGA